MQIGARSFFRDLAHERFLKVFFIFRYMYGGEVTSLRISDDDIVSQSKCLSISDQIGRHLRDENKIRYKLKLMKVDNSSVINSR